MISESRIKATIADLFDGIRFPAEPAGLYDPLRYMISIGGKRIRPALCLTTYALFKDYLCDEILEPAAALEVFHSFTLIHDDIMDRSPLRRGVPTVWKKWKEDTAILSGDVMLIDSYTRISKAPSRCHTQVMELFSRTAAQVCEGQQYDMEFETRDSVPMREYDAMIGLKTAVLIACAAKMGALIGGADEDDCESLYSYGYYLGMAFQVADDYLDAFGDEAVFGKPIGGDIINGKKSWLTVRAFEKTSDAAKLSEALNLPSDTPEQREAKIAAVKDIYVSLGVDSDAKKEIERFSRLALDALRPMHLGAVRQEVLRKFADSLVGRVK